MTNPDDYDDFDADGAEPHAEDESPATETVEADSEQTKVTDQDALEAETLTVTAKQHIRDQLEDEVARFLAQGGKITEVPPDPSQID